MTCPSDSYWQGRTRTQVPRQLLFPVVILNCESRPFHNYQQQMMASSKIDCLNNWGIFQLYFLWKFACTASLNINLSCISILEQALLSFFMTIDLVFFIHIILSCFLHLHANSLPTIFLCSCPFFCPQLFLSVFYTVVSILAPGSAPVPSWSLIFPHPVSWPAQLWSLMKLMCQWS